MSNEVKEELNELHTERETIRISVRNLVEFILRSGDLDDRIGGGNSVQAMQAGSRIHRKLQKRGGTTYHAEVPLKFVVSMDEYDLGIEGRADGIIYDDLEAEDPEVTIDEIKGMYTDVSSFEEPVQVHLAQAKVYGFIFSQQNDLASIGVQMTYVNLDTEDINRFYLSYTKEQLEDWFEDLIARYRKWSDFQFEWSKTRDASIHQLAFPYDYRPGQKELVANVYRSIVREKTLFIQAPTGTGKTLSTIYPAVQAVGQKKAERIFYLTAKTITRAVARDTFSLLGEHGYRGKTVEIVAKDKMCPLEKRSCNPDDCQYAKGHFDRVNDAVYDLLHEKDMFDRDSVIAWAKEHLVCPFEFCLDVSSWCDNILCDYNYVYDPNVALQRFFGDGIQGDNIILVDEAHNMVDRAREMYSETIYKEDFLTLKKLMKDHSKKVVKAANHLNTLFLELKKECTGVTVVDEIDQINFGLLRLAAALDEFLEKRITIPEQDDLMEIYFRLRFFLTITEWLDEHYTIYFDFDSEGRFALHLYCVDPSLLLHERIEQSIATVFFSATLLPVNYYKELLTTEKDPYAVYASSVFAPEQSQILIGTDVTSRYKARGDDTYQKMARYIYEITSKKNGNYIAFCPSYRFMEEVHERFLAMTPVGYDVICQTTGMLEEDREMFLEEFQQERKHTLVAFCVLGGIFSEGIDLTEDALIGAIILGTGLPQVGTQTKLLQNFFDQKGKNGFDYSYLYPGMNKVQQAAGRVIRTEKDRGIIALLDDRFTYREYQACFPREWKNVQRCTISNVGELVGEFWEAK